MTKFNKHSVSSLIKEGRRENSIANYTNQNQAGAELGQAQFKLEVIVEVGVGVEDRCTKVWKKKLMLIRLLIKL